MTADQAAPPTLDELLDPAAWREEARRSGSRFAGAMAEQAGAGGAE